MTSVDEDLARVTSRSLTMGSSIIANLQSSSVVFPSKLHPALYDNSLSDVPMTQPCCSNNNSPCRGVLGFPDFPDCWQGATSGERENRNGRVGKKHTKNWKVNNSRTNRQQRRLVRKAVNPAGTGKEIKKRLRGERRMRTIEKAEKLQRQCQRKRDMAIICRGMASTKFK